jgi:hypothetical protein
LEWRPHPKPSPRPASVSNIRLADQWEIGETTPANPQDAARPDNLIGRFCNIHAQVAKKFSSNDFEWL